MGKKWNISTGTTFTTSGSYNVSLNSALTTTSIGTTFTGYNTLTSGGWTTYDEGAYLTHDSGTGTLRWYNGTTNNTTINLGTINYVDPNMKTKYLDDKFQLIYALAGFKKEEVSVKYLAASDECSSKPYIEIKATSKDHPMKEEYQTEYIATQKHEFSKVS